MWHVATGKKFFSFKARDEEWVDDRAEYALSGAQFDTSGRKLIVSYAAQGASYWAMRCPMLPPGG